MWNNIERSYYVYGHYRKDSNELFYIGFLGISSNAHILDVLNKKRISVKGWEVKYDL